MAVIVLAGLMRLLIVPRVDDPLQESLGAEMANCPKLRIRKSSRATVICFAGDPLSTRGEARFGKNYAPSHHFEAITVVTTADQVARAWVTFARCWAGPLSVVKAGDSAEGVLRHVPYQIAAFTKAMVWEREC